MYKRWFEGGNARASFPTEVGMRIRQMLLHPFHAIRWQTAFVFPEKNGTVLPFLTVKCHATVVPSIPCLVPSQVLLKKGDKIK